MSETPDSKQPLISRVHPLEALSLFALFGAMLLFIASVLGVYGIPYGLDFGEGYLANMSFEMFLGANPYHSLNQPPWIVSSYPPLYPVINGLIMSLTGPSLIPGRFIATASLIGIIATAILVLRKQDVGLTAAILAAGIMLVFPWSVRWSQVVRVDTLGILFTIGGVYYWIRSEKSSDGIIAAILFAAGALTKHSLLAAPLACLVHAFVTRDRRRVMFLILLAVLIGGSYGILNLLTGGGLFQHLFTYTANAWFTTRFTAGIGEYFKTTWLLQILAVSSFLMSGTVSGKRRILGWYYLTAHLVLITYGLEGSDSNYFIEPLLATALLSGLAIDRLTVAEDTINPIYRGIPSARTIAYALVLTIFVMGRFINATEYKIHRMTPDRLGNGKWLLGLVHDAPEPVLCEYGCYPFIAGKQVTFQPYIMSLLSRSDKWNQDEFVETIINAAYSMIILRVDLTNPHNTEQPAPDLEMAGFNRWTVEMEEAIMDRYFLFEGYDVGVILNSSRPVGYEHRLFIYLPKPAELIDSSPDDPLTDFQ